MVDDKLNKLNNLEQTLYSRTNGPEPLKRSRLEPRFSQTKQGWQMKNETPTVDLDKKNNGSSFLVKILLFSFAFFLITVGVAFYVLSQGRSSISGQNINFNLTGPLAVKAGDEVSLQIVIANSNQVPLQNVKLILEFPLDTKSASSTSENLRREILDLGTIESRQTINKTARAIFFGQDNDLKQVRGVMEYNIPNSNALYTKTADLSLTISVSPITLAVDLPQKAVAGQEIPLIINITPQAQESSKPFLVNVDYPEGFIFTRSNIKPDYGDYAWLIKDPKVGEMKEIIIYGILNGESQAEKIFKVTTGSPDTVLEDMISFPFNSQITSVVLANPFVDLNLKATRSGRQTSVFYPNDKIEVVMSWTNNLESELKDVTVELDLAGLGFNPELVSAGSGYYDSLENKIKWDKTILPSLTSMPAGHSGEVKFSLIATDKNKTGEQIKNPNITLDANLAGITQNNNLEQQIIKSDFSTEFKIASSVNLKSAIFYYDGPFQNTGPLPPKVGEETTYTVTWLVENPANLLKDTIVKTVLPPYVIWKGQSGPATEIINYNANSREVVWQVGQTPPASANRGVSFSIGFKPGLALVGKTPDLTNEIFLTGFDTYAEIVVEDKTSELSTRLVNDSRYSSRESKVEQ